MSSQSDHTHPDSTANNAANERPARHGHETPGDEAAQQHPEGNVFESTEEPRQGVVVDDGEPSLEVDGSGE